MKEKNIQNLIRIYCGQKGIPCFRCNVGKFQTIEGKWIDTGLPDGFSDLLILPPGGNCIFCEVKTTGGKQREDQKRFQDLVTNLGYTYIIARSVDDVKEVLNGRTR